MSLYSEYRNSLKNPYAEELIDLVFYRPLAFILVKLTLPLPFTPNFISFLAMIFGIMAGVAFSRGSAAAFLTGGLLFGLSNILDCMDGMVARLKKNGTKTGRIVDGMVDYIASIAVYTGLGIGLSQSGCPIHLPFNPWLLLIIAGISSILHSISSDKYRNAYILQQKAGGVHPEEDEFLQFGHELARLKKTGGHLVDKFLIMVYLRYLLIQKRKSGNQEAVPASETRLVTPISVVLWNLIGPSTRISAIILAALFYKPIVFFIFTIIMGNVWMLLLYGTEFLQKKQKAPARNIAA